MVRMMLGTKCLPSSIFDHVLWIAQAADGSNRRAAISLGNCILLFTSLDAAQEYLNACEEHEGAALAVVFSRNRKEFGSRARQEARAGVVGALFDPDPRTGQAPFLRFAKADS